MNKKIFFFLFLLVIIFGLLLVRQINLTRQTTITRSNTPIIETELVNIPVEKTDASFGSPGAGLQIVEFNNLNCEECQKTHGILYQFAQSHPEEIQLVWKNLENESIFSAENDFWPLTFFCANKQNKFWQLAEEYLKNPDEKQFTAVISAVKISTAQFNACLESAEAKQKITQDRELIQTLKLQSAPVVFVNNRKINVPKDIKLEKLLEEFINKTTT